MSKTPKKRAVPKDAVGIAAVEVAKLLRRKSALESDRIRAATIVLFYRYMSGSNMFDRHLYGFLPIDMPIAKAIADELGAIPKEDLDAVHLGRANEVLCDGSNGSYYTPLDELVRPIVAKTFEPIFRTIEADGPVTLEKILSLRVCDPAVGAGVFLITAIDYLAERLMAAGYSGLDAARRTVACYCVYGVDIDAVSVFACKAAITLHCKGFRMSHDWLDDNIKHGDALVGLTNSQIKAFHWKKDAPVDPVLSPLIDKQVRVEVATRKARMVEFARDAAR